MKQYIRALSCQKIVLYQSAILLQWLKAWAWERELPFLVISFCEICNIATLLSTVYTNRIYFQIAPEITVLGNVKSRKIILHNRWNSYESFKPFWSGHSCVASTLTVAQWMYAILFQGFLLLKRPENLIQIIWRESLAAATATPQTPWVKVWNYFNRIIHYYFGAYFCFTLTLLHGPNPCSK